MLAAISTTILSNRSWALTCSAMVSRSRLSKTRGPPDALRICWYPPPRGQHAGRSEEHTSELQSRFELVCRLLLEKKNDIFVAVVLGSFYKRYVGVHRAGFVI